MSELEFRNPYVLLLLIPYGLMVCMYLRKKIFLKDSAIALSSEGIIRKNATFRTVTYRFMPLLRFISILLLIIAAARPGRGVSYSSVKNLGIDIMIALDISGSMSTQDFEPGNRLTAAKNILKEFIALRKTDRIGLVVFAREAYLQCPLTVEYDIIRDIVDDIDFGVVDSRSTAIGDAIAMSASRMMDIKSRSRVILLLTDGANNSGIIDPETASRACRELGIKIYTVGIGRKEYMRKNFFGGMIAVPSDLDLDSLKKISDLTGGKSYNATSGKVLWENIQDIDRLERSEAELRVYHEFSDRFQVFLLMSLSIFFLEIILKSAVYRKIP